MSLESVIFDWPPESALVGGLLVELLTKLEVKLRDPETARLGDGDVLDLRVQPLDLDAEVLLERQLHRIVDRQPAHG